MEGRVRDSDRPELGAEAGLSLQALTVGRREVLCLRSVTLSAVGRGNPGGLLFSFASLALTGFLLSSAAVCCCHWQTYSQIERVGWGEV